MLSKKQFCQVLNFAIHNEEREEAFSEALQKFAKDTEFTGFYSNLTSTIIEWLAEVMHDEENQTISWWLYDCPNAGKCKDDNNCSIWLNRGEDGEQKIVLRTPEDLYDYLVTQMRVPDDEVMTYAFNQQTEGIKFAIHLLDKLEMTNASTGNDGWQERSTLLTLAKNKIRNEYMLETGADDPAPKYPIENLSLITKGTKDE